MLELKHISYRVSTPEGEMDIIKDISITIPVPYYAICAEGATH